VVLAFHAELNDDAPATTSLDKTARTNEEE
jgi:hypothetical protein